MTDKELRRLSRAELLEILLAQMEKNETLERRLAEAEAALSDRRIDIEEAGTLAQAALKISGIFRVAQDAADRYLENLQRLSEEKERVEGRIEAEAKEKANAWLKEAKRYSQSVRAEADAYLKKTHDEGDAYLQEVSARAAQLLRAQENLRQLLDTGIGAPKE